MDEKIKWNSRKFLPMAYLGLFLGCGLFKGIFFSLSTPAWHFMYVLITYFTLYAGWYCKVNLDEHKLFGNLNIPK